MITLRNQSSQLDEYFQSKNRPVAIGDRFVLKNVEFEIVSILNEKGENSLCCIIGSQTYVYCDVKLMEREVSS